MISHYIFAIPVLLFVETSCNDHRPPVVVKLNTVSEQLFYLIDTKRKGTVTYDEWQKVYGNNEKSIKLFEHYDSNANGKLTRGEYLVVFTRDEECKLKFDRDLKSGLNGSGLDCFILK